LQICPPLTLKNTQIIWLKSYLSYASGQLKMHIKKNPSMPSGHWMRLSKCGNGYERTIWRDASSSASMPFLSHGHPCTAIIYPVGAYGQHCHETIQVDTTQNSSHTVRPLSRLCLWFLAGFPFQNVKFTSLCGASDKVLT
jgi:hypothetical protein